MVAIANELRARIGRVLSVAVIIGAFQAPDPGSTPGARTFCTANLSLRFRTEEGSFICLRHSLINGFSVSESILSDTRNQSFCYNFIFKLPNTNHLIILL